MRIFNKIEQKDPPPTPPKQKQKNKKQNTFVSLDQFGTTLILGRLLWIVVSFVTLAQTKKVWQNM